MKQQFKIRGQILGDGAPVFIIAEAGSNHLGSLETALGLIDVAAAAEVDAVKFQTFKAERLYAKGAGSSDYLGDSRSINDIIKAMEMPESWLPILRDAAHAKGMGFLSTPFHLEAVGVLEPLVDAFKIASYELSHHPLLRRVAQSGKPVIMSTGAHTAEEVAQAVEVLRDAGCEALVLLQCTAAYPAPPESMNVRALTTLREQFGVPSGLSDHSRDPVAAPMAATALGAAVIEKHFTLSNHLPGPDHAYALEPHELERLVRRVRETELLLGSGDKVVQSAETELRDFARRCLFTTRAVASGEAFTKANVDVLRTGKLARGLDPGAYERVLGARATQDLEASRPLQRAHVDWGDR